MAVASLRLQDPDRDRPFRLPAIWVLAPAGFVVANLVIYWSGWTTVWRLMAALAIGYAVYGLHRPFASKAEAPRLDLRSAAWLPPYLIGTVVISYAGRYKGGQNWLPFWVDLGVVAAFSLAIFALAVSLRLSAEDAKRYVEDLDPIAE